VRFVAALGLFYLLGCSPTPGPQADAGRERAPGNTESIAAIEHRLDMAISPRNPRARTREFVNALGPISASSSGAVAAWLDRRLFDLDLLEIALIVQAWADADPEAATSWASAQSPPYYELALTVALRVYARSNFAEARDVLERHLVGVTNAVATPFRIGLVQAGYDAGAAELIDYLIDLGNVPERQTIIRSLVRRKLLRETPQAVIDWAEALSAPEDPAFKYSAILKLGLELPAVDPELAKEWASRAHSEEFDSSLLETVTRGFVWAGRAHDAFDWLLGLPIEERSAASPLSFAFGAWLRQDPASAEAWARNSTHDARSDPALRQFGLSLIEKEGPEIAFEWIERLQNPAERERGRFQLARRWFGLDPDGARAWLEDQDFDDTTRSQILAPHVRHSMRKTAGSGKGAPPSSAKLLP